MKLGISGFGFVGQAMYGSIDLDKTEVIIYDPPKGFVDKDALLECPTIFCCLPTLCVDGLQDFSVYKGFFELIEGYSGLLIIKSTVLYKNIEPYLGEFDVVMSPEFLNQANFKKDFYNQSIIILGGRMDLCRKVEKIFRDNFKFAKDPEYEYCTLKKAIEIKYLHNTYHAWKILFWNYINEIFDDERSLSDLYSRITGNNFELQRVYADGKAGYGGSCFPKDVKAMHEAYPHILTEFMMKYNLILRKDPNDS